MLSGEQLGQALKEAIRLKKVTQAQVAREFGIAQPSVSNWTKTGRIDKEHIDHLMSYFSDVVTAEHWGLHASAGRWSNAAPAPAAGATVGAAAMALARSMAALPDRTRKLVAEATASLVVNGPNEAEAKAIDALTGNAQVAVPGTAAVGQVDSLEDTIWNMAEAWEPSEERNFLLAFLNAALTAHAGKVELNRRNIHAQGDTARSGTHTG